jgi:ABC-type Na+ efflux pump permease subunit
MATFVIVLIAAAVLFVLAVLVSEFRKRSSEKARHRGRLNAEAEERRTLAGDKRRRATELSAKSAEHAAEAERLDREAADELEAARTQQELEDEARAKAKG